MEEIMTKQEFLETLGRILNRELSEQEVAENIRYYDNYITQEVRNGKIEAEVLSSLGDPRLIARTILQVDQQRSEEEAYGNLEDTVYTENADGSFKEDKAEAQQSRFGEKFHVHMVSGAKSWIILILVLIIIWMVLSTVFKILWKLLPVLVVAAMAYWLYQKFTEK